MPTPVLATKLFAPPQRPRLVARPRLLHQLDAVLDPGCRLVLVSAPAGFGKNTVLSDWLDRLRHRTRAPVWRGCRSTRMTTTGRASCRT